MKITLPIRPKIQGTATSGYTRELVEARLRELADRTDAEAERKREYLRGVMQRKGWNSKE